MEIPLGGFGVEAERRAARNILLTWVFGTIGVVLTVALLGYNVWFHRTGDLEKAQEATRTVAHLVAGDMEHVLDGIGLLFDGMEMLVLGVPEVATPFSPPIRATLLKLKRDNPYLMDLLILDAVGEIVHWSGPGDPPAVHDRDYAAVHLAGDSPELFIGDPTLSRVHDGRWFFGASRALRGAEGALLWIVVAIIDIAHLDTVYGRLGIPPGSTVLLTSSTGTVYTRLPDHGGGVGDRVAEMARFWASGRELETLRLSGATRADDAVVTRRRLNRYPLAIQVAVTEWSALRLWRDDATIIFGIGLFITFGISTLSLLLVREMKREYAALGEMERMANVDYLTGLANRRHFMARAQAELERAGRYDQPLAVVMLDVDKFKAVNDTYGHEVGDEALRGVAEVLREGSRQSDVCARYGGEEFVVLLPGTSSEGAVAVAQKLRSQLAAKVISGAALPLCVTASFGVTEWNDEEGLDALLSRADEALYLAKEGGRDRVEQLYAPAPSSARVESVA